MPIQIHPDAAKRFNEVADQLLTKITSEPEAVREGKEFRPDVHPVAHIRAQDIIGEVSVRNSIFDGTGAEVGRFWEHQNGRVGLIGPGFNSFAELAIRIHDSQDLKETTSSEFILDTSFEWLEGKHKNARPESLAEYVVKRVQGEIKDFEIWIPLHRTYIESSFQMGGVVFRTITREMMDECEARTPKPDPETAIAVQVAFARDRSAVQGCAAAATNIRAEIRKAVAVARERAESAVALLRFLSPANWTPKLRSYCTLLGSENVRQRAELFLKHNSIVSYNRGVLDAGTAWSVSTSYLAQFPGTLDRLNALSSARNKTPFQQNLYDALLTHSRNSVAIEPADKLLYVLVALESMLLRNDNEPLGKNVGERLAFLVGDSLETRKEVLANAVEVVSRQNIVHPQNE
jgi:hypothetical protein